MPKEVIKLYVDALPIDIDSDVTYVIRQSNPNSYTHEYFKYPCKFIPEIPRWGIKYCQATGQKIHTLIDPFCGSGTSLLEASLNGIISVGAEIDDVAILISKVKTTKLSFEQMCTIEEIIEEISQRLDERNYTSSEITIPLINNLFHWYSEDVVRDLGFVVNYINGISDKDIKNFMSVCFASILKKVSFADDISPKPYVSRKVKKNPLSVRIAFIDLVNKYLERMKEFGDKNLAQVLIRGNARKLLEKSNSIDLAITSPPYINAFDYGRTLRLENLWLKFLSEDELREKKKEYIGTEVIDKVNEEKNLGILGLSNLLKKSYENVYVSDKKRALILKKFFEDMFVNLQEVRRVLCNHSKYIVVIGDSRIRGISIESWKILKELAEVVGFKFVNHFSYEIQNSYIRIPRGNKGGKIGIDHILILEK